MIDIVFTLHGGIALLGALMVVASANPVHSVLFLVITFLNVSALFILLEAEFLGLMFIVVYVGAIAVLFLFVVMMLNVKIVISKFHIMKYIPVGGIVIIMMAYELLEGVRITKSIQQESALDTTEWIQLLNSIDNIGAIALLLYDYHADLFIISGIVLLLAMIGAIALTSDDTYSPRKQISFNQIYRSTDIRMYK